MSWGRRYGRPVRLGKNPTRPKTRILAAGDDACRLLERLHRHGSGYRPGLQAEALRQIIVQNYYRDAAGRLRWRTADDGGLPPSSSAIISPYDTTARYVRHGHIISWKGFAAHVTETCASGSVNVITDVATTSAASNDGQALPASTPAWRVADCCRPSIWSTAATPPSSTWNEPPANTRSPSADHCRAPHPPAPQERRRVRGLRSSGEPGRGQADGARLGLAPSCQACAAAAVNAACTPWAWSA